MKDPSIWIWWYLMLLSVPLMVLALFVNDMIKTPARQATSVRNRMQQHGKEIGHVDTIRNR